MSPRSPQRGFNIIEILVTLVIVALISTLALPMYSVWLQNSQLRASAESIMAGLQHSRSEAVRLNDTAGVRFSLVAANAWETKRVTSGEIVQQGGGLDLAKNAVVTPDAAINDITFSPLGVTNPPVTLNIDVTHVDTSMKCIADGGDMRCLRVQVRPGGLVRLCDPSVVTVGDPRMCLP